MCAPASVAMLLRAALGAASCEGGGEGGGALRRAARGLAAPSESGVLAMASERPEGLSARKVRKGGVTLQELGVLMREIGVPCECMHAHADGAADGGQSGAAPSTILPASAAQGEAAMLAALARLREGVRAAPGCGVLVNYHMSTAGQRPFGGHVSPIAAYHAPSDRFLVLDTWPQTGPTWLSAAALWAAMAATDDESGLPRGWLVVARSDLTERDATRVE